MCPIPHDKYGRPIYSKPFAKIIKNSNILSKNGYSEAHNKPNLYYKKIPDGVFFADMRSSEIIPIWEDTRPLFYWNFNNDAPMWKRRRLIKQELVDLLEEIDKDDIAINISKEDRKTIANIIAKVIV